MAQDVNYYPEDSEPVEASSEVKKDGGSGADEGGVQTALIPKSMLMGYECKPGDKITLEVVHLYEDEVEVKFLGKEKGGEPESKESSPEDQLDLMAKGPEPTSMNEGY
jgi:hypothetical protein